MSGGTKILTGLVERRALEAQFAALAEVTNPEEAAQQAEAIAAHGSAALAILVAALDTEDPQVRGNLGQVAKRLEREQVVAALRGVARSNDRSDQARIGAVTLLDHYLGEPVDESLLAGLRDPDDAALRSLRELVQAMDRDPASILDYLKQLAEQPPEVAGMILDAVPRMPSQPYLVTLLRMFAQDSDRPRARLAIEQLGRTRSSEALLALDALAGTLPPDLVALVERNRRKLRLSGVREPADEAMSAPPRVLISPVDGNGTQIVWFSDEPVSRDLSASLTVIVRDPEGIVASFWSDGVPVDQAPPAVTPGKLHILARQEAGALPLQLLEASLDVGRRAVRRGLERHWEANTAPPLEYRLMAPLIWGGAPSDGFALPESGSYSAAQTAALLDHPAFGDWFWHADGLLDIARRYGNSQPLAIRAWQVRALAAAHFGDDLIAAYRRRLEAIADWLAVAGQSDAAALAMSASGHLADGTPAEAPFVRRLIGMALDVAGMVLQAEQIRELP